MDRVWHHTTLSGPERPRLGQQPYDRGRGLSSDRRGCYECGKDGHILKHCPQLDNRNHVSGRHTERSTGGSNGRWSHDSWPLRIASSGGKDHGYSRTEGSREGSNSRRSHSDYHDNVDFSQRPRDTGERHRDNESRSHGVVTASSAHARERDSKSSRGSSRKVVDEYHQSADGHSVKGHRSEERREEGSKDSEVNPEKVAANGEVPAQCPLNQLVAEVEDLRIRNAVQDDAVITELKSSEVELVTDHSVGGVEGAVSGASLDRQVTEQLTDACNEIPGDFTEMDRYEGKDCLPERDHTCLIESEDLSIVSEKPLVSDTLQFSISVKDVSDGTLESKPRTNDSFFTSATQSSATVDPIVPSSAEKMDAVDSSADPQQDTNLDSPSRQDEGNIMKSKESDVICNPGNQQQFGRDCIEGQHSVERIVVAEHEQTDVSVCDERQSKSGSGKRISRWDTGRREDDVRVSNKDAHVLEMRGSDAVEDSEIVLLSCGKGSVEQDQETQNHHIPGQEPALVGRDVCLPQQSSDNGMAGFQSSVPLEGRDDYPQCNQSSDGHLEDVHTHCQRRETEAQQHCLGSSGMAEQDCAQQIAENVYSGTLMKGRNHSRERDSKHDAHIGLGSRESSVDRTSDRHGHARYYGRTGLKDGYRRPDYGVVGFDQFGRNTFVNLSDLRSGENTRERRGRGGDWRQHYRNWEAPTDYNQYHPGSYVSVCNARFLQYQRPSPMAISPPSAHASLPLDQFLPSNQVEDVKNTITEPQRTGWMYNDPQGNLQGPVPLAQLKELLADGKLQSDYMVQLEGSNEWVTLEHAWSPLDSNFIPSSLQCKQSPEPRSPRMSRLSHEHSTHIGQELSEEDRTNVSNADKDICPPGTEAGVSDHVEEDSGSFHIDERVEKLMDGIILIPGKEKEIVHDALSSAARRVLQEYESDIAIEESPRSHGGFADLGDQWKDGDFGSDDVQGFGVDQPAAKEDVKVDDSGSDGVEVVSAPEPPAVIHHTESRRESWKWPSFGGDWVAVRVVDNSQQMRVWETQGQGEKGYLGIFRKVVMNGGRPLCDTRNDEVVDPRKKQDSGKGYVAEKLQVPKFGLRLVMSKVESCSEDQHASHNQHSVTSSVGAHATTPKSQSSTPRAHLSTPLTGLPVSAGARGGQRMRKSGKSSSTQGLLGGIQSKSLKSQQQLNTGLKSRNLSSKCDVKNIAVVDKRCPTTLATSFVDGAFKPGSENNTEDTDKKSKQVLLDGSVENPSPPDSLQQGCNLELFKLANSTLPKKLFLSSNLPSNEDLGLKEGCWFYLDGAGHEVGPSTVAQLQALVAGGKLLEGSSIYRKEDDIWVPLSRYPSDASLGESALSEISHLLKDGRTSSSTCGLLDGACFHGNHPQFLGFTRGKLHEFVMKSYKAVLSAAISEGLDKWLQSKEQEKLSALTAPTVAASSLSSHLVPASLHPTTSTVLDLPVSGKHQIKGLCKEEIPQHEKLHDHSVFRARSSFHRMQSHALDDGVRMMEVEGCCVSASDPHDTFLVSGDSCLLKRKAWSLEDGVASRQHHQSQQRRRVLDNDGSDDNRKPDHSSHVTLPQLIDHNPTKTSEVNPHILHNGVAEEHNWAALKPSILRAVFRSLRGDVKTLVNAMATCRSWLLAGTRCKTELKQADLSSFRSHSLDAVLESLPGFGRGKLKRIILKGCTVSPESLAHLLRACPSISAVEIGGKEPFKELIHSFPKVRWLGEHNRVQSPRIRLNRKREDSHLKIRSLKAISQGKDGIKESLSRDGDEEIHITSDSASKVRSPEGDARVMSVDVETLTNDSVQDSEIMNSTRGPSDVVKHLRLNNGGTPIKGNGANASMKTVKHENGNNSRLQLGRKMLPGSSHMKYRKVGYRMLKPLTGGHRGPTDKHSFTALKVEHHSKSMNSSAFEGDRSLEKELATVLKLMMDADPNGCFHSAHIVADGKGVSSVSAKTLDLSMIEKKLKSGAYAGGKHGFKAFQEDVNLLTRNGFRNKQDTETYSTAEKIFKVAHQCFKLLETQLAGTSPGDPHSHGKVQLGSRSSTKVGKGRVKNVSILHGRPGNKRKTWDDDGGHKGKCGVAKRVRQCDSSSDVDSDSDSTEQESRRFSKLKKERWWGSEVESSEEDEVGFMEDDEETETEPSDSDVPSESEGEDGNFEDDNYDAEEVHIWGARMTKAAMVPPVTRKYAVIEEYLVVADKDRVEQKMKVELPKDYEKKLQAAKDKQSDTYSHLDIPDVKEYRPRKKLGDEVLEQEVYGIDPYTHNLLWDTMPGEISGFSETRRQQFIEECLLLVLNKEARQFTGSGKAPMEFNLERVVERILVEADIDKDWPLHDFTEQLLSNMRSRPKDKFVAYRKGLGVVCNKDNGLEKDEFVVEFFGEVYPPWRWYEKQDGIRSLQKKDKDTTPEFYNIVYERPKGDAAGYDLLVVDAMHKANFASRLCHSCRPNCEAKITAVNNTYIIGVYTLKPIKRGEELTFDYNSVTESKEEYNNAVCLCGSQGCRGSYLNLTGSGTFEEVIMAHHRVLDRNSLLLESCITSSLTEKEFTEMKQAGLGSCLLSGLPDWVLKYAARLVQFMNFEKLHLPAELLKDFEQKRKKGVMEGCTKLDAEITTEGVYNQRLQNLAITLDKVRHIFTKLYRDPQMAPPPLRMLDQKDMVQWLWKRDDSVVNELLQCLGAHLPKDTLSDLKQDISKHEPHDSGTSLRESLLWLRDELRKLPATCKARHDAAADLIHVYAYTKHFFAAEDYEVVESSPINIHPLDLGSSRHSISGTRVWHKTYSKDYVWGQLINWYKNVSDPGASLAKSSRGCLTLPDVSSCYAKSMQHDFRQGYGQKHREKMIWHMEEKPQQKWPKSKTWSQFWCFKNERGLFGSPMLDCVLEVRPLDAKMVEWLKKRKDVFVGPWDEQ